MEDFVEYISLEDIFEAYYDCRKKKRKTINAIKFEADYEVECVKLWREINTKTYEIGKSIVFIISRPVRREVFAADFRDRIVQHLIVRRLEPLFEEYFIYDNYNCRKNKGVLCGIKRLSEHIKNCSNEYTEACYVAKCDIQAFFMSIYKPLLWKKLKNFINERYNKKDKDLILWLTYKIVMHCPERNCIIKSPKWMWKDLPPHKSLFKTSKYYGLAIGNITSQMFANFYMTEFDVMMIERYEYYGRYVDDFHFESQDKDQMLKDLDYIRHYLKENLKLNLHPKKLYLQTYKKGCKFIGSVVKGDRMYVSNRSVGNFVNAIHKYSILINKNPEYLKEHAENIVSSLNSYYGLLSHFNSYNIRKRISKTIPTEWSEVINVSSEYEKMICKMTYKKQYNEMRKAYEKVSFLPDEYDTNKYDIIK